MGIFAAVAAVTICMSLGILMSSVLIKRCEELELIILFFRELYGRIQFSGQKINVLMEEIAAQDSYRNCRFIRCISTKLNDYGDMSEKWTSAANETSFISESDKSVLIRTGQQIGASDTESQLSLISSAIYSFEQNLNNAKTEKDNKTKLIISVWTFCGIGAGIMLI